MDSIRVPTLQSPLQARLWDNAYQKLKKEQPKLVLAYEELLFREFGSENFNTTNEVLPKFAINQTCSYERQSQMVQLVRAGLRKTEKVTSAKRNLQGVIDIVSKVRDLVNGAIISVPQAAVVWTGVCFALEILSNPLNEAISNRDGIAYVLSRMEWYWNLSPVLEENRSGISAALGYHLEIHLTDLYKDLLAYQMGSACLYYRSKFIACLRDVVKLDDWERTLESIKSAERDIKQDINTLNETEITSRLGRLVENSEIVCSILCETTQQTSSQEQIRQREKNNQCLRDLRVTDPSDDKTRIEHTGGRQYRDSSNWILEHEDFQQWRDNDQSRILWIEGKPGERKTMLLVKIIDELHQKSPQSTALSYFFCESKNSNCNNAQVLLRGLIYRLAVQEKSLLPHLLESYDVAGSKLFMDENAFFALSKIFKDMLCDTSLSGVYIIINALDECMEGLPGLLKFIVDHSFSLPRVKWAISSCNRPDIKQLLQLNCYEPIPKYLGIRGDSWVSLFVSSTRRDQIKGSLLPVIGRASSASRIVGVVKLLVCDMNISKTKLDFEIKEDAKQAPHAAGSHIDFKVQQRSLIMDGEELSIKSQPLADSLHVGNIDTNSIHNPYAYYHARYDRVPEIAVGLTSLDMSHLADIRIRAFADEAMIRRFKASLHSWADTKLYYASMTYLEKGLDCKYLIQTGTYNTRDTVPCDCGQPRQDHFKRINFTTLFKSTPHVITWLNSMDMSKEENCRVMVSPLYINRDGFFTHVHSWAGTVPHSVGVTWIAYPADQDGITGGRFQTCDVRHWDEPQSENSNTISFPTTFEKTPKIIAAIDTLDYRRERDLCIRLRTSQITKQGFTWHLDSWRDSIMYSSGASYLAWT
ncbi:hypothetical protein F5B19DRAFT_499345 [Rostrohypoxylon terebratum]|nr:hypothetical protein F5B19DRAFT_499345 [Rostrohypoxylon terebratum]